MLHPHTTLRYIDAEIGYGVFATQLIPKGTVTWALDIFDQVYTPEQVQDLDAMHKQLIDKYAYRDRHGDFILCWDFGRYINHSFDSNCMATAYDFEVAVRDIQPGEELTNDYGYLNLQSPFKARVSTPQRLYVMPDDLVHFHAAWDQIVLPALRLIFTVEQPLWSQLNEKEINEIKEGLGGKRALRSVREHYYDKLTPNPSLEKRGE